MRASPLRSSRGLLAVAGAVVACGGGSGESRAPLDGGTIGVTGAPSGGTSQDGGAGFLHPGVLVNQAQLTFVKQKISAKADPWSSALAGVLSSSFASTSYAPQPIADVECGSDSNPDVGCSAEMNDAIAAYTQALLWVLTGTETYAKNAIAIMNAWSSVLMMHTDSNAPLQSAWAGSVFVRAAEIARWTNAGWADPDVARFEAMLRNVYLPEVVNGAPRENGNWELSMVEATIGIAVFLDDRATFDKALATWRARVPAYVYVTSDGAAPLPPPGGDYPSASDVKTFWYSPASLPNGLCQETCRDLGHVQYGFAAMIHAAETARIQGTDLYSEQEARITAGLELHAQYLGSTPPASPCSAALVAVTPDPTWEIAYNEYANRLGESLQATDALIQVIRPTGTDHHMDWETLTHAEVGAVGLP